MPCTKTKAEQLYQGIPQLGFISHDTSQTKILLYCDIPAFILKGTTDFMIIDEVANRMDDVFAGLQLVIELKKDHCGDKERCQILIELVAADLKSECRCSPIGLLTNLNDYCYFLWFTPDRKIARMVFTCPANGFKMVRELLTETMKRSAGVFSMQIPFLSAPLPKRRKLLDGAPSDDTAREMLKRYELMSDVLSPEFLLARRMEYEIQSIRDLPIHSGLYG